MRKAIELITAQKASDGAGVKLLRVFGGQQPERFDPFLMLDEFGSEEASDYIGGFPSHPHRGFETITYMLRGKMEHRDHMDNVGLLQDGDVQWMTAGRGIIHSEMPQQTEGQMRGFQLWLNLAADKKLSPAGYQDIAASELPRYSLPSADIIAIAGNGDVAGQEITGYFQRADTEPLLWDIHLNPGHNLSVPLAEGFRAMVYVYDGELTVANTPVAAQHLLRLSDAGAVYVQNDSSDTARFLLIGGKPLKQPIVQYGPFVMNSQVEIEQALRDYREGRLTAP